MSQGQVFDFLKGASIRNRLGHSLLLVGKSVSSEVFRQDLLKFLQFLSCPDRPVSGQDPCGVCESCKALSDNKFWNRERLHPDVFYLSPDSMSSGFAIDSIKQLRQSMSLNRSLGAYRLVIVENAELLSAGGGAAANALLKGIEEPRPQTLWILLTERLEGILQTIRSRSQVFRIPSLETGAWPDEVKDWNSLILPLKQGLNTREFQVLRLPPDGESFWKDKDQALSNLQTAFVCLWNSLEPKDWAALGPQQVQRIQSFFDDFQELISRIKGHGNPSLQWFSFRSRDRN